MGFSHRDVYYLLKFNEILRHLFFKVNIEGLSRGFRFNAILIIY